MTGPYALEVFLTQGSVHANGRALNRKKEETKAKIAGASPGIHHFFLVVVQWAAEAGEPQLKDFTFLHWDASANSWGQILRGIKVPDQLRLSNSVVLEFDRLFESMGSSLVTTKAGLQKWCVTKFLQKVLKKKTRSTKVFVESCRSKGIKRITKAGLDMSRRGEQGRFPNQQNSAC